MEGAASLLSGCNPVKRPGPALGGPRLYFLQLLFSCRCVKEVESAVLFFMVGSAVLCLHVRLLSVDPHPPLLPA